MVNLFVDRFSLKEQNWLSLSPTSCENVRIDYNKLTDIHFFSSLNIVLVSFPSKMFK